MVVLNGLNKVSITDIMKQNEKQLVSEYDNKYGFVVREYFQEGLIIDKTIITTQLENEDEVEYVPSIDMRIYATQQRLNSKNTKSLASIYYDLLV